MGDVLGGDADVRRALCSVQKSALIASHRACRRCDGAPK